MKTQINRSNITPVNVFIAVVVYTYKIIILLAAIKILRS